MAHLVLGQSYPVVPTRSQALAAFRSAAALGVKVSVVSRGGMLIAIANWGGPANDPGVLGHGWSEYVDAPDVLRLLQWFAEKNDSGPICYVLPSHPRPTRVCLVKSEINGYWLVIGEETPAAIGGAPSPSRPFLEDQAG